MGIEMIDNKDFSKEDLIATKNLRKLWFEKLSEGMTQKEAAKKMGFKTQSAVSQYINGQTKLGTSAVLKWAKFLGVSPDKIDPRMSDVGKTEDKTIAAYEQSILFVEQWLKANKKTVSIDKRLSLYKAAHTSFTNTNSFDTFETVLKLTEF